MILLLEFSEQRLYQPAPDGFGLPDCLIYMLLLHLLYLFSLDLMRNGLAVRAKVFGLQF